jgi:hypothetical protein
MISILKYIKGRLVDREFTKFKLIPGSLLLNGHGHRKLRYAVLLQILW